MKDLDIKFYIEDYVKCLNEMCEIKKRLNNRVWDVAQRYVNKKIEIAEATDNNTDDYPGGEIKYCGTYTISHDCSTVIIDWDENWRYGGHDSGTFYFPSIYLYDEEVFLEFLKSEDDRKQEILEEIRKRTIDEKRKMVEKLQKELESIK